MEDKSRKNDKKTINMFLYRTLMPVLIGLSKIIVGVRTDKSRAERRERAVSYRGQSHVAH